MRISTGRRECVISRLDAARELEHLLLHRYGKSKGKEVEAGTNVFASALLMPWDNILTYARGCGTTADVQKAKKLWDVSAITLTYRIGR
ncbi:MULTISPECIES: ImmA/IrrE family metallo-endopeptidase [unclassified Pseudomonas]|uniref:ImmA/IrrE family metallo-endopeptidase n=1 Tax=unclassified Pseudomonas TaxID=196821 RepID=UPI0034DCCC3A